MNSEIRAAMDKNDTTAARAAIAHYHQVLGDNAQVVQFLDGLSKQLDAAEHRKTKPRAN